MNWNIAQAKQHFSEVVKQAAEELQLIYNRRQAVTAVVGAEEFAKRGTVRSQPDMLIAATAQAHAPTLVTRNIRDSKDCGIGLLNPFTPDPG